MNYKDKKPGLNVDVDALVSTTIFCRSCGAAIYVEQNIVEWCGGVYSCAEFKETICAVTHPVSCLLSEYTDLEDITSDY